MPARPKSTSIAPDFLYWKQRHVEREQRRVKAIANGDPANYAYWIEKNPPIFVPEPDQDDTPPIEFLNSYRLEINYKDANQLIAEGAESTVL